jgi:hypothetical protein
MPTIARRFNTKPELIKLTYLGRDLRPQSFLSGMRIPNDKDILVYIAREDALLVKSERFKSVPSQYQPLVARLVEATGKSDRSCGRCLAFCNYDYDAALRELLD